MRKALLSILGIIALLAAVVALRTARLKSVQLEVPPAPPMALDEQALAQRLAGAVRIDTVSDPARGGADPAAMAALRGYLERSFPRVHAQLKRELVGQSLLFTWPGTKPELEPVALLAHLDVVPAEAARWKQPPFEGRLEGGFVWGRGTLDDKGSVLGILEAVEALLAQGYAPQRTVLLAFGQDEEIGGPRGAAEIAKLLAARGVKLASVLDEGEIIGERLVPGVKAPVALLGIAEKGYLSVELSVEGPGGHSSMPSRPSPAGILAEALLRLERNPFPTRSSGPTERMFQALAPEMGAFPRMAFANLWLFGPLVRAQLAGAPSSDALQRTTTAITMLEGSPKENVLPSRARAVVNLRILPGESVDSTLTRLRDTLGDPRVQLRTLPDTVLEPSEVSDPADPSYATLAKSVREVFPGTVVAPALVLGGTDSAHYRALTRHTYRFLPVACGPEDLERFHGPDERIGIHAYADSVRFYARYIQNASH